MVHRSAEAPARIGSTTHGNGPERSSRRDRCEPQHDLSGLEILADERDAHRYRPDRGRRGGALPRLPARCGARDRTQCVALCAQATATDNNALRARALEVEVKLLREMLDAMREDRNAWREQASKVVAALPLPITTVPDQRRSWWRRLVG